MGWCTNKRQATRCRVCGVVVVLVTAIAGQAMAFYSFGDGYGNKWGDPGFGTPAVVTWGYMTDGTVAGDDFRIDPWSFPDISGLAGGSDITSLRMTVDAAYGPGSFDAAIQGAFDTWASVADITFIGPLTDNGLPINDPGATAVDIRIGAFHPDPTHSFKDVGAVGFAPPWNGGTLAGDVLFNLDAFFQIAPGDEDVTPIDYFQGNDIEGLFLHELGHAAIGLGHPDPADAATDVNSVMYVGWDCCTYINREPAADDVNGAVYTYGAPVDRLPGDFDGSGAVDTQDINPFVLALTNPAQYEATYGLPPVLYDTNGDWTIDTQDINPFVTLLTGGAAAIVPEPSAGMLLLAVGAVAGWPRRLGQVDR